MVLRGWERSLWFGSRSDSHRNKTTKDKFKNQITEVMTISTTENQSVWIHVKRWHSVFDMWWCFRVWGWSVSFYLLSESSFTCAYSYTDIKMIFHSLHNLWAHLREGASHHTCKGDCVAKETRKRKWSVDWCWFSVISFFYITSVLCRLKKHYLFFSFRWLVQWKQQLWN